MAILHYVVLGRTEGGCWLEIETETGRMHQIRLQAASRCINAGNSAEAPAGPDLDNGPRIIDGVVDLGAYEWPLVSPIQFLAQECRLLATGAFQVSFTGGTNAAYDIWASDDLSQWARLGPAANLGLAQFEYSDFSATNHASRFYRAAPRP